MQSFSRMLVTIEQQASDVNEYARRLDTAYKELESTSAQLKEFSFKDEVTGLYNRRFFSIRLEEEVSRYRRFNHPVSVVLLDLDGFKAVNDDLGHAAGDETLRAMAEILLKQSRGINVICRYGGDEFAVLLVETTKSGARLYADRIRYVLSTWTFAHGRRVTASFGIASLPEDVAPAADELIRAADEALYAAKRAGKNRVSVHEDVAAGRAPAGRGRDPVTAMASARRVLIVDDERDIRTTLRAVFGSAGYECRIANNGREAAKLFEAERSPLTDHRSQDAGDGRPPAPPARPGPRRRRRRDHAHRRRRRAHRGREPQAGRQRLHPEAGQPRPGAALGGAGARAPPAPDRAPRAPGAPGVPGVRSHPRPGRRPRGAAADLPDHARGAGLRPGHPRARHRAALPPRPRVLARPRPLARAARGRARRAGPRGAPARHRQDRHLRRDPAQAGAADPRGVGDHAEPPGDRPADPREHPVPARRDPGGATITTSAGTAPGIRSGSPARPSRWAPASSRSPTPSTP